MNYLYIVLAKLGDADLGWLFTLFKRIRSSAISGSQVMVQLALATACIITALLLIKLSYDIMSDEQSAGFGGVRLWTVVRPVLIIITINAFPLILRGFDSVIDEITTSTSSSIGDDTLARLEIMDECENIYSAAISGAIEDIEEENEARELIVESRANMKAGMAVFEIMEQIVKFKDKLTYKSEVAERAYGNYMGMDEEAAHEAWMGLSREQRKGWKTMAKINSNGGNFFDILVGRRSINWANIAVWFFKYLYPIVICSAEIMLCLLAFFGPWALVLSLLPWWKDSFRNLLGSYIQLSFWKPIGAAIVWIVGQANSAAGGIYSDNVDLSSSAAAEASIAEFRSGRLITFFIAVAGIMCLFKVPAIAAMIIPTGQGPAGGEAAATGAVLGKMVADAPKKAAGTALSVGATAVGTSMGSGGNGNNGGGGGNAGNNA